MREKKAAILEALGQTKEPAIPELLSWYLDLRSEERSGWTSKGKLKGAVADFDKVQAAMKFLREKGISTVESLNAHLDTVSSKAAAIRTGMKQIEKRIEAIDTLLSYIESYEKHKPVHAEYAAIGWKGKKEKFAAIPER